LLTTEAPRFEECNRQRVSKRQRCRRARGRREPKRARLFFDVRVQMCVRFARNRRAWVAGYRDQLRALAQASNWPRFQAVEEPPAEQQWMSLRASLRWLLGLFFGNRKWEAGGGKL